MADSINWVTGHWVEIGSAVALIMAAVRAVVALTPTKKDDEFVGKIIKVVKAIGLKVD